MAAVWTKCRGGIGEQRLAAQLEAFNSPDLILCFSLDFIPGAREIDLLILHKEIGVFIVETKAVSLTAVKCVSPQSWQFEGRASDENPLRQAYAQYEGFRDYIDGHGLKVPTVGICACFPKISRYEWRTAFPGNAYALDISDGCLFSEDLSDIRIFENRLKQIMLHPPMRKGRICQQINPSFLTWFRSFLDGGAPIVATLLERERLKKIEESITKELQTEFTPGISRSAIFSGLPGTGKTFRLLAVAFWHAYNNKRVLFACFNKTLASDLRRLASFSTKLSSTAHGIDILDINQLALRCFDSNSLDFLAAGDANQWGELVVDELCSRGDKAVLGKYHTILIDEAQDMQAWHLALIELHAASDPTICIAIGKGQELYTATGTSEGWLSTFAGRLNVVTKALRRNFRNTRSQYFAAQAFYEAWPDKHAKIEQIWDATFGKKAKREQQSADGGVLFDRPDGEPLKLISIPMLPGEYDRFGENQDEIVSTAYLAVLQQELDAVVQSDYGSPIGLLILAPSPESVHARHVRLALAKLSEMNAGVGFIDYTMEERRRSSAQTNEIRFCTYHSSRGLEGERVVIFGLDQVKIVGDRAHAEHRNLAFIALSRGIFTTTVVLRTGFESVAHSLLGAILRAQEKQSLSNS